MGECQRTGCHQPADETATVAVNVTEDFDEEDDTWVEFDVELCLDHAIIVQAQSLHVVNRGDWTFDDFSVPVPPPARKPHRSAQYGKDQVNE